MTDDTFYLQVIDHHLDSDAGVYRLEIGIPITRIVQLVDENGRPHMTPEVTEPVIGENGEQTKAPDGSPGVRVVKRAEAIFAEQTVGFEDTWDYVFAADDPRWEGRELEEIAAEQRRIVVDALTEQVREVQAEAARRAAARTPMPGTGGPLDGVA